VHRHHLWVPAFAGTTSFLIAGARLKAGLSQARFAELLGVSKRMLQQWEQGRRKPSGAARTLLELVERHPKVLRDLAA
jgi:putative transcriptional regulator